MCKKFICFIVISLALVLNTNIQADVFSDNFDIPRDYLTEGVEGTGWDGFLGLGTDETVDALNASIDRPGSLYIESNGSNWEAFSPRGPFLYKIVEGDFIATVNVTDFPGLPDSESGRTDHTDSFIMARVPNLADAGDGEDFECVHYFPTWSGNIGRDFDDGGETEWGVTGNGFDCDTYLQLERVGNTFHFRTSSNGQIWSDLTGSPVIRDDMAGLALQVGLAHSMYSGNTGYVAFDDFSLEGPNVFPPGQAYSPNPAKEAEDVLRDSILSWIPAVNAVSHDVYIGTSLEDITSAGAGSPLLVSPAQNANTYDPGRLEFGQTYYWRIDEIESDGTIQTGLVWSFTVEPFTYPIPSQNITATASSQAEGQGPEKTIDGSGLVGDLHSTELTSMWFSQASEPGAVWIQYDFDKAFKLHEMLVWNYNGQTISTLYGFEAVTVEYSPDGANWTQLDNVPPFSKATGEEGYAPNTTVAFNDVAVKSVRITANNNHGGGTGFFNQYGLSEVIFMQIPVSARMPSPESGATDVAIDTTLYWRAGREAAEHNVYLSTDQQAVIDGTATTTAVNQVSYNPPVLDLGSIYYWRIDEVNSAQTPSTWQSDIWNFSTQEYLVVDDFESYNDIPEGQEGSHLVYIIWADGLGNAANGSTMGYFTGTSLETDNVHGGSQSVPLFYDNTSASLSEVVANTNDLATGSDWSIGSPQALVLWIHGDPSNAATDQLYVKVGSSKVVYDGDIARPQWMPWSIDLAAMGVSLSNVSTMTIGIERTGGSGGSGIIFLDDIRLYGEAPELPEEIWIEAESGTVTAPMMIFNDDPNASGGQYIGKTDGDGNNSSSSPAPDATATYTFTVSGGKYVVALRVYGYGTSDGFWARIPDATAVQTIDGADATLTDGWLDSNNFAEGSFWHWVNVVAGDDADDPDAVYTLEPGTHTLLIANRDDGTMLDAIVITKID